MCCVFLAHGESIHSFLALSTFFYTFFNTRRFSLDLGVSTYIIVTETQHGPGVVAPSHTRSRPAYPLTEGRDDLGSDDKFLLVKNWDKFQHYGDRTPPWIKLYNSLLEDFDFAELPDQAKAHLVGIWLLASRLGGKVPNDAKFIASKIGANSKVDLGLLIDSGWLVSPNPLSKEDTEEIKNKSKSTLASCYQNASKTLASDVPDWIDLIVWSAFVEMRQKIRRPMTKYAERKIILKLEVLKEQGNDPNEVLNRSIENSWQGVFALPGGNGNGQQAGKRDKLREAMERVGFYDNGGFEDAGHLRLERGRNGGISQTPEAPRMLTSDRDGKVH